MVNQCEHKKTVLCNAGMIAGQPQLRPSFSLHMEVGRGAATLSDNGIAVQQEIPLTHHLKAEARVHILLFIFFPDVCLPAVSVSQCLVVLPVQSCTCLQALSVTAL